MTGLRLNIFWQDYHIDDVSFSREILKMEKNTPLNDVNDSVDQGQCWGRHRSGARKEVMMSLNLLDGRWGAGCVMGFQNAE